MGASGDDRAAPVGTGVGLRLPHLAQILGPNGPDTAITPPWFELLADNHLAAGGPIRAHTAAIAQHWPLTLHCVGMNLAGTDPLAIPYLDAIRELAARTRAAWVSDHLCFTACHGQQFHDLLPFAYTEATLTAVAARVQRVQEHLGQSLVIENVSAYLRFHESALGEAQFLAELVARTGCGLLLDLNNLYVNHINHGDDMDTYLAALPLAAVREIHLAGYSEQDGYLLDTHSQRVHAPVWALYRRVLDQLPEVPTLIEWDNELPSFAVLCDEARRAETLRALAKVA